MKLCTSCGHRNADDSAFCEACGAALRPKAAGPSTAPAEGPSALPVPSTPVVPAARRRLLFIAGGVLVILIGLGIGASIWLSPPAASERNFAAAAQRYLDAHPDLARERTCLRNFRYDQDPVTIVEVDARSRKWFDMLVEAGLYQASQQQTSGGWFPQNQLLYKRTEAGGKAVQGNRLCFADGLAVKRVSGIVPPRKQGDLTTSRADVVFEYRNQAAWSRGQAARELAPDSLGAEPRSGWTFAIKDGKWEVADTATQWRGSLPLQAEDKAPARDWWSRLKDLFSAGGGNPLIGKWETSMLGMMMLQYEFTPDSMRVGDTETKVRYEVREGQVVVYPEGQSVGLIVKVVDHDTITLNAGLAAMQFKRVR